MALLNDPRAFTGGAVAFDSNPSINLYAQLQARKQAKDDALNQYFTNLQTKINTAGTRVQDLDGPNGGIAKDIENWRKTWMENKDAIKKGGMSHQQYMSQFQDILRKIQLSKDAAKKELEIGKAKFEGKYDPDEDDLNVLDKLGRSIYDKEHYKQDGVSTYGWGDLSPAVKDFDEKKFSELVIGGRKPIKQYGTPGEYNPQTGQRAVPFDLKFEPETIKEIANEGALQFKTSKEGRKYANKLLKDPNSPEFQRLNKAYQKMFPPQQETYNGMTYDIPNIMDTPEKVGAAVAIVNASGTFGGGEEMKMDVLEQQKRQQQNARLNSALIAGRAKAKEAKSLADYDVLGAYEGKIKPITVKVKTGLWGSEPEVVNAIPEKDIDANDKKLFSDVKPYTAPDGTKYYKVLGGMDLEGKGGQIIYRAKVAQANLDKTALNEVTRGRLDLKPDTKAPTYKIKGKTYTEADLIKMGYTPEQIKPYRQ